MAIGQSTIDKAKDLLGDLLDTYRESINEAYIKTDELSITLNVKITPDSSGNEVKVAIKFVAEQVKDTLTEHADEEQISMFTETLKLRKDQE